MEDENFQILNKTRSNPPYDGLLFADLKKSVLGKKYELSLVWCGHTLSRRLNRDLRGKDNPTNILSFPLSDTSGEIFIDVRKSASDSKKFNKTPEDFLKHLFIHGLHHLKGMEHSSKMEREEEKTGNKFGIKI